MKPVRWVAQSEDCAGTGSADNCLVAWGSKGFKKSVAVQVVLEVVVVLLVQVAVVVGGGAGGGGQHQRGLGPAAALPCGMTTLRGRGVQQSLLLL